MPKTRLKHTILGNKNPSTKGKGTGRNPHLANAQDRARIEQDVGRCKFIVGALRAKKSPRGISP